MLVAIRWEDHTVGRIFADHLSGCAMILHEKEIRMKAHREVKYRSSGFTLIELMIVVAVIAILATIALPSYDQYIVKANRRAAQADMLAIANKQQQYFPVHRAYATTLADLGFSLGERVSANYVLTSPMATTASTFSITMTPLAGTRQANDGVLVLTSEGVKTRDGDASKW
jgi:type IV pilus assembly protein PilE